ncbi:MAG TPA: ribosome silencing factor [Opitutaceae bacterium]|nr:ribosome silencing factor [Opitutaceae bacterium]
MNKSAARKRPAARSRKLLKLVVRALDDKKAEDLQVLDVRDQSSITDYLVLATGTSEPHLRALRTELEKALEGARVPIIGVETTPGSGWTVFDAFEIMVHLFTAENRAKYRLELLWRDASRFPVDVLLAGQAPARRDSAATRRRKKAD